MRYIPNRNSTKQLYCYAPSGEALKLRHCFMVSVYLHIKTLNNLLFSLRTVTDLNRHIWTESDLTAFWQHYRHICICIIKHILFYCITFLGTNGSNSDFGSVCKPCRFDSGWLFPCQTDLLRCHISLANRTSSWKLKFVIGPCNTYQRLKIGKMNSIF